MSRVRILAVLLLCGCFSGYDAKHAAVPRVHRGTFVNTLVLTGELEAQRGAVISVPRLPMWQTSIKWLTTDGELVREGDRVAELDTGSFSSDLDNKRQLELEAEQQLQQSDAQATADLDLKKIDLAKKQEELEKAKIEAAVPPEIISARDFEDRRIKLLKAQVEYAKARSVLASQQQQAREDHENLLVRLDRARRDVEVAESAIEASILRAPRSGVVVIRDHPWERRKLQAGDGVWVGIPIAQLPDLDSLEINAALADVDDGRITVGMPAVVTVDGYPATHFNGRIASIAPVAQERMRNEMRRAFRVAVKLDRVDTERMRPGLSARVEVRREVIANALLVPRAAIDFAGKTPRVKLAGGRTVDATIGSCNAQDCVVRSGLSEGQQLENAGATRG